MVSDPGRAAWWGRVIWGGVGCVIILIIIVVYLSRVILLQPLLLVNHLCHQVRFDKQMLTIAIFSVISTCALK